jgi:hypothetical protein
MERLPSLSVRHLFARSSSTLRVQGVLTGKVSIGRSDYQINALRMALGNEGFRLGLYDWM